MASAVETETYATEPIQAQQSLPSMSNGTNGDRGNNPTDELNEEINGKYEQEMREIARLRSKLQSLRRSKPIVLRKQFEDRRKEEEEREKQKKQSQSQQNDEIKENQEKEPCLLSKLKLKMKEYKELSGHGNKVYGVDWNPHNNNRLVSVGRDGKLLFWYADTGYKRMAYQLDTEFIMTLKYSPDARFVACGGLDDVLSIFENKSDQTGIIECEPKVYKAHTGYISCLEYIDNNTILTSSGDKTIREWDLGKIQQTPSYTYKIHREDVMSMHINPNDPNLLLTGSVDSTTKIIDLRIKPQHEDENKSDYASSNNISTSYNGNITHSFYMGYDSDVSKRNRSTDVNVVKWFPNGQTFVAGCDDGTVRLFDMRSGKVLSEYSYHKKDSYQDLNGYKNGRNSNDNTSLVKTSTNTPIGDHEHKNNNDDDEVDHKAHEPLKASDDDPDYFDDLDMESTDGVAALDFSKSGAFMFVSYNNDQHEVLVWNILTNRVVSTLQHPQHVPCLKVSPDGRTLVTACWNHNLKLWK